MTETPPPEWIDALSGPDGLARLCEQVVYPISGGWWNVSTVNLTPCRQCWVLQQWLFAADRCLHRSQADARKAFYDAWYACLPAISMQIALARPVAGRAL